MRPDMIYPFTDFFLTEKEYRELIRKVEYLMKLQGVKEEDGEKDKHNSSW